VIVIVAALTQELAEIRKHFRWDSVKEQDGVHFHSGSLGGEIVTLVVSGVGAQKAARATRLAVERFSPKVLISIGYAGGLAAAATPGRLIIADRVLADEKDAALELRPDAELLGRARSATSNLLPAPLFGALLTVPAVVATREAKKALREKRGVMAVDMESAAVGAVGRELGVPCVYFRCITDGPDDEIPISKEVSAAFRGRIRLWPFIWGLAKRPSAAIAVWRLFWRARRASKALADAVTAFCEQQS